MSPEAVTAIVASVAAIILAAGWGVSATRLKSANDWVKHWKNMYTSEQRVCDSCKETSRRFEKELELLKRSHAILETANTDQGNRLAEVMAAAVGLQQVDGREAERAALRAAKQSINAALQAIE